MHFRNYSGLLFIIFLFTFSAEAQMLYKPHMQYQFDAKGKKKEKKTAAKPAVKQPKVITTEIRTGLGFFTGFAVGEFNKDVYTGYGFNVDGEYFLNPKISVGLNTGYHSYKYDEIHMGIGHFSMIPVQLRGAYYFLDGDFHPFAGINAGMFLTHSKYDSVIEPSSYIDPITQLFIHKPGEIKPINENETAFGFAPMAGIVFKASDLVWINCNLRYNLIFTERRNTSAIGFHVGFTYSFGI